MPNLKKYKVSHKFELTNTLNCAFSIFRRNKLELNDVKLYNILNV